MLKSRDGVVEFKRGDLVQVYRSDLAKTVSNERKLTPMWSSPRRIVERMLNSYILETLDGVRLSGEFNVRRLRRFVPREGTNLAREQMDIIGRLHNGEGREEYKVVEKSGGMARSGISETRMADEQVGGQPLGCFYEEDEDEATEEESTIGERVSERRRGRRHTGGGQME